MPDRVRWFSRLFLLALPFGILSGCGGDGGTGECGDGRLDRAQEVCDDGAANGAYGHCAVDCTGLAETCGDAVVSGPEQCDDGPENGTYGHCDLACKELGPRCGDGLPDPAVEVCDDGLLNGTYDHCADDCLGRGDYCGDGAITGPEACDDGPDNGTYGHCAAKCLALGPTCGDGLVAPRELCDGTVDVLGATCSADCLSSTTLVDLTLGNLNWSNCLTLTGCQHPNVILEPTLFSSTDTTGENNQNYLNLDFSALDFGPDGDTRTIEFDYTFDNPLGGTSSLLVDVYIGKADSVRFTVNGLGESGHAVLELPTQSSFTDLLYITFAHQNVLSDGVSYSLSNVVITNRRIE